MPGVNERRETGERIMHYGVHEGKRYKDVPKKYLKWVVENAFQGQARKQGSEPARVRWAREELERRNAEYEDKRATEV